MAENSIEILEVSLAQYRAFRDVRGPDTFASITPANTPSRLPMLSLEGYPPVPGQDAALFYKMESSAGLTVYILSGRPAVPFKDWLRERLTVMKPFDQYQWGVRQPKADEVDEDFEGEVNIIEQMSIAIDGEAWSPIQMVFREPVSFATAKEWLDNEGALILAESELLPGEVCKPVYTIVKVA